MVGLGHHKIRVRLGQLIATGQFPQTVLFHGLSGSGKKKVAIVTAQTILCEAPQMHADVLQPCQNCRSCQVFAAGNHPDFFLVEPTQAKSSARKLSDDKTANQSAGSIKVEQVALLKQKIMYAPVMATRQVVVIDQAALMTATTANSLLKILEEPRPQQIFILVTHSLQALLMTIRSRCVKIFFPHMSAADALAVVQAETESPADKALLEFYLDCFPGSPSSVVKALNAGWDVAKLQSILAQPHDFLRIHDFVQDMKQADVDTPLLIHVLRFLTLQSIQKSAGTSSAQVLFLDRLTKAESQLARHIATDFVLENLFL